MQFEATVAQVIPVLLLTLAIEFRTVFTTYAWRGRWRWLEILLRMGIPLATFLAEGLLLYVLAFGYPEWLSETYVKLNTLFVVGYLFVLIMFGIRLRVLDDRIDALRAEIDRLSALAQQQSP